MKVLLVDGEPATWCPACRSIHLLNVHQAGPRWTWNGDTERPTFEPSVRVRSGAYCCHYFVRDGQIMYCNDSTHELAGQTIALPDAPQSEIEFWT
jgi:hypothetical protein